MNQFSLHALLIYLPVSTPLSMASLPLPPSMKSGALDGRAPPVAVAIGDTKTGVLVSSAFVPAKVAMKLILNSVSCARLRLGRAIARR